MNEITKFTSCVYSPRDIVEIRQLMNGSSEQSWHYACELPDEMENLTATNLLGWNIYVGIAPRPDFGICKDENIKTCRCFFADFDGPHFPDDCPDKAAYAQAKAAEVGLPQPTLVVDSGHGTHLYWRFKESLEPKRWKKGMRLLSAALGSDTSIGNPERIMRLPGLMNNKAPARPCRILFHDSALTYGLTDFAALKPPQTPPQTPCVQPPKLAKLTGGKSDYLTRARAYMDTVENLVEGEGRNHKAYTKIKSLWNDKSFPAEAVEQAVREWNLRNRPPLEDKEMRDIIGNSYHYTSKKPAGCDAEAQKAEPVQPPKQRLEPIDLMYQRKEDAIAGKLKSYEWTIPEIDLLTNALEPGRVIVIVGPAGSSKSLWIIQEGAPWFEQGIPIAVLECEKDIAFHMARIAAQRSQEPGYVRSNWCYDNPIRARAIKDEHDEFLRGLSRRMTDATNTTLTMESVTEWIRTQAEAGVRIIICDPISIVDKDGVEIWTSDKRFLDNTQKIATEHNCSVIIVAHPDKAYDGVHLAPSMSHIGGGKAFADFSDTVLWLDHHENEDAGYRTSYVNGPCGKMEVNHNRTICIVKGRDGGQGRRIACNFSAENLKLKSEGVIVPKPKK